MMRWLALVVIVLVTAYLLILRHSSGRTIQIGLYVDDAQPGGKRHLLRWLQQLLEAEGLGKLKVQTKEYTHTGLEFVQRIDFSIEIKTRSRSREFSTLVDTSIGRN